MLWLIQLLICIHSVFAFPFFLIGTLNLRRRQLVGLVGVFSIGLITMIISLARFVTYTVTDFNVDDASGSKSLMLVLLHYSNEEDLFVTPEANCSIQY